MINKNKISTIIKIIKKSKKIVFFHHIKPDGDSISSSYGFMKALQKKFPNKEIKWFSDKKYIEKSFPYIVKDFDDSISKIDNSWTAIIGDTSVLKRIWGYEEFLKAKNKICFDHHQNDIDFKVDVFMQNSDLGASSVQAYMIVKKLKIKLDDHISMSILFGILTDTFNFSYSLNDTRPIIAAKELLENIKKNTIDNVYKNLRKKTEKSLKFQAFVLNNFKIENGVSYFKLKDEDIKKMKIEKHEYKQVHLIGNIENVLVWMFIVEDKKEDLIKISLRSNGFPVNKIAEKFGGGGHQRASGIAIKRDWLKADEIIKKTQKEIELNKEYFKK